MMNTKTILGIIALLFFYNLNAQISIAANTSVSGQKFKIDLKENSEKYFITLKILDSISRNNPYKKEMEKYRVDYFSLQDQSMNSDSVKALVQKMEILTEKNSLYSSFKTKIKKRDYPKFDALIKLFKTENAAFFEKRERNKNRIVLDGTLVKITVKNMGKTKTIWSDSPCEKTHPEINNLLTSTLHILRGKFPVLNDKKLTVGY